uniref:Photosystem II protein K n=1 Tax=Aegilops tauschii subsp. strangulata TaxID=200361 RepID=A0A453K585_AEGTS
MPNILSLTCICLNSVLYPTSFFFAKLPEAYAIFNPIVDIMPVIPLFFFSSSLCLASCCKFSM